MADEKLLTHHALNMLKIHNIHSRVGPHRGLGWKATCPPSERLPHGNSQVVMVQKEGRMKKSSKGFSLIELLIVVAIILIIAAIAIPDLMKSRQAANQASAVGSATLELAPGIR